MAKIYLVGVGEYSDHRTVAAFSEERKADAEKAVELIGGIIEEMTLDPPAFIDPGIDRFFVQLNASGKAISYKVPRLNDGCYGDDSELGQPHKGWSELRTYKDNPYERRSYWRLQWMGYADSEEHAVRNVNELRVQILAGQRPEGVDFGKN